ncbi:MAG: hypothetical protein ACLSFT_10670 [Ruminococcus callidus]
MTTHLSHNLCAVLPHNFVALWYNKGTHTKTKEHAEIRQNCKTYHYRTAAVGNSSRGGWYFLYPYSLGSRISTSEPLSLSVNITGVTVTGKDTVDTVTYEFQPDTQEYKALVSLLNDYDYHRSFLTLLPLEDYTPDSNTTTFQLQSTDSQYLLTDKGGFSAEPVSGGKSLVYAIGYLGSGKAEQLTAELQALLKSCTPVETHDDTEMGTT